jgi:hypothetical protein
MKKTTKKKENAVEVKGNKITTEIKLLEKPPKLVNPVLIEGLPGIGFVGKLAAEHMVEQLKAKKIGELYSHHFPHQVLLNKDGTLRMLKNDIHVYKDPKKKNDIVILTGDVQPVSPEAQYEVMSKILDFFEELGGKKIYTLGGYSVGKLTEKPRVFGSVSDKSMVEEYKKVGVTFGVAEGSIVGAAGLLVGLGQLRGMKGICFMGETHGNYIDHRSAQAVLALLSKILGISIDTSKLSQKAKESEEMIRKLEEETRRAEAPISEMPPKKPDDLTYIR